MSAQRRGAPFDLRAALVTQFRCPHGLLGRVAGWIMTRRKSNRQRNLWTIDLLAPAPTDRVLDIGCGPGFAVSVLAQRVPRGHVVGLDHSDVMLSQAHRHNRQAVAAGRVTLVRASYRDPAESSLPFDRIMAVNSLMFDSETTDDVRRLHERLKPGGVLAVTCQSRAANANDDASRAMADRLTQLLEGAGLRCFGRDELPAEPACAVCVRLRRPDTA